MLFNIKGLNIKVATIDTMLSFYLAFYYSDNHIILKIEFYVCPNSCLTFNLKNRLQQKGLLKRFSINCIGTQPTLESIRVRKKLRNLKN